MSDVAVAEKILEGYRLSTQQKRVWLLHRESEVYRVQCALLIEGDLDAHALVTAIRVCIARHEILRTVFQRQPGIKFPLQVVTRSSSPAWQQIDLTALSAAEQQSKIEEFIRTQKRFTFDLEEGPLLSATLLDLSAERHSLLLSLPAICVDGVSLRNLVREIGRFYTECRKSPNVSDEILAEEVTQYAQFSEWQHELLEAEEHETDRQYWTERRPASVDTLRLPFEITRLRDEVFAPESLAAPLESDLEDKLSAAAREHHTSVEVFLLACWSTLLWRLTQQPELSVGLQVDGRKYEELEDALGFFAKIVPVDFKFDDVPFREIVRRVDERARDAYALQEFFSWEDVTGVTGPQQLFAPFSFSYEEWPKEIVAGNVSFTLLRQDNCLERSKISLQCFRTSEVLTARFQYDPQYFRAAELGRLAEQFRMLLAEAINHPDSLVGDLNILSEDERRRLLVSLNNTRTNFRVDACLHQLFEEQAARKPEATAVVFQQQRKSYRALNDEANQLAHYLRRLGVGPEVCVGLCVERSLAMLVGVLGVMKAGGVYVPLDPEHPAARLGHQLADVQAPVLITQQKFSGLVPDFDGVVLLLDENAALFANESAANPVSAVESHNLAYVIYTSGSTGTPKGVAVSHRNLVNYTEFICRELQLDASPDADGWTFATVSTLSADLGHTCIFPSLVSGGCLHVLSYEVATDAALFVGYVKENPIDVLKIVPSHLRQLLIASNDPLLLPRRYLITGGEALSVELAQQISSRAGDCRLLNHYGPTETTVGSLVNREAASAISAIDDNHQQALLNVPIGRPIANTTVYILDQKYRPVPQGVAGELYIGGQGVARGYLRLGGLTAERFLPDPFGPDPGGRMYRTGDRGRLLPDGTVEFLGRVDEQIKIRGYRIEPGEIEATLLEHEEVTEAVVTVQQGEAENRQLVAYVVARLKVEQSANRLKEYLRERLPDYMLPSVIVPVAKMPLTQNGKVDRRALAAMQSSSRQAGQSRRAEPRTEVEEQLADIWREVLGVAAVGVDENFFELGGDSILSIQIIARANQKGLRLTPRHLFDHPTIAELAAVAGKAEAVIAEQGLVSGPVPLTPIQQWFFAQRPLNLHHWNMALMLEVRDSAYDATVLKQAVAQLLVHHDALRLRYSHTEAGWRQFNAADERNTIFREVDLSGLPETQHASAIEKQGLEMHAGLQLEHGPLVRVVYFNLGGDRAARLLFIIHHLAVDGVSWRILLNDLMLGCEQVKEGKRISFPPKTTSFKQWAEQLQQYAQSEEVWQQSAYWMETAARSRQVRPLPVEHERASNKMSAARMLGVRLDVEETKVLLQELPEIYHTEINEVLLTALVLAFAEWTGERRVLVDMEGHGREDISPGVDVTRTVGWFTTHYPLVLEVTAGSDAGAALNAVKAQVRAVPQRGIGYGLLRYLSEDQDVRVALSRGAEASVSFNYLGQFDQTLAGSAAFAWAVEYSGPTHDGEENRAHLLDITGGVAGGELFVNWVYNENIHRRGTIEELANRYTGVLRRLIELCRSHRAIGFTPSDFPEAGLTQPQLDQLLGSGRPSRERPARLQPENVEDLYTLSPTQEGMLFHSMSAPEADVYLRQTAWRLKGRLDVAALERAFQALVDRHTALRTSFVWGELDKVLQVVQRRVQVGLERHDWQHLSNDEQSEKLKKFLEADRTRGFDLTSAPLMRLMLIRLGGDEYQLIWTYHHLVLDGWARSQLHKELFTFYDRVRQNRPLQLPAPHPYREYIAWLRRQDMSKAEEFWRQTLAGFTSPPVLSIDRGAAGSRSNNEGTGELYAVLSAQDTAGLHAVAQKQQLTLNTVVQGAWAMILSCYSGEQDIVFGATVSGRPPELPGVETMVGVFLNTLPVRVSVSPDEPLTTWLKNLQQQQVVMRQYEYTPLAQIKRWCKTPRGVPLFENILVLENYPIDTSFIEREQNLHFSGAHFAQLYHYPLALTVQTGGQISLHVPYSRDRFSEVDIAQLMERLKLLLQNLAVSASHPEWTVRDLMACLRDHETSASVAPEFQVQDDAESRFVF